MGDSLLYSSLEVLFYLIVVLGIILAIFWLIKNLKWGAPRGNYIQIKERVPLDGKHFLILARIGDSYLLLAAGEKGVTLIKEFPASDLIQPEDPDCFQPQGKEFRGKFPLLVREKLQQLTKQGKGQDEEGKS